MAESPPHPHTAPKPSSATTNQLTSARHEIFPRATVEANCPPVCLAVYPGQHRRDYASSKVVGMRWPMFAFAFGPGHVKVANNMFFVTGAYMCRDSYMYKDS
ncbi:Ubiquitin [Lasiodiplodia theobromae]|uniref:Ubiquitin n=1 Tax=Lasiodiplodia theobromae TaxID=45133 RepID=UPI0015C35C49|nr:Ubiquitin [Lasiodiplodia theobromae]KAF4534928.1 Ubiquitin [Lasiodiplodia theobromae]